MANTAELLELILEREKKERKRRQRRLLTLLGTAAGAAVVAAGLWAALPGGVAAERQVYSLAELDRSRVEALLMEAPLGLRVSDEQTGDTLLLRDLQQYALLMEARQNPAGSSPADWESNGNQPDSGARVIPYVMDEARAREIRRRVAADGPLTEADIMPAFPGGESALHRYLSRQLRYPVEASRNKVQGTVYLRFVIDENGKASRPEVMRGIGHGCDEEAMRVISAMPAWVPGEVAGVKVPVYATLAINFRFL